MHQRRSISRRRPTRPLLLRAIEQLEPRRVAAADSLSLTASYGTAVPLASPSGLRLVIPDLTGPPVVDPTAFLGPLPDWALFPRPVVQNGLVVDTIDSPFQRGPTRLRVLLPDSYQPARTYRVVYVLPVEPGNGTQYGDGLETVRQANLHNIHGVIFVAPSFTGMPWYADHATDVTVRQESHLIRTVIPFVESRYRVGKTADARLLLGFSKSGYGAFSLLLRNPAMFGRALAWNAPLTMSSPRADWGVPAIVGSASNFANYRVTSLLQSQAAALAGGPTRLLLVASSNDGFRRDHASVSGLMSQLGIPHASVVGPARAHSWRSGWVPDAVQRLVG
jgi:S-formylglutathione hydrolase FrmB